jgi:hypothetical protein
MDMKETIKSLGLIHTLSKTYMIEGFEYGLYNLTDKKGNECGYTLLQGNGGFMASYPVNISQKLLDKKIQAKISKSVENKTAYNNK